MKKIISSMFLLAGVCLSIGCVSGSVNEPNACISSSVGVVPASPIQNVDIPPVSFSVPEDFSGTLKKVDDVANNVNLTVNQLSLSSDNDMQWVNEVEVSIAGNTPDLPSAPLAGYFANGSDPGNTVSFQMKMDGDTLQKYLSAPVVLTFTISGRSQPNDNNLSNTTCLDVSGDFSKSL